MTLTINGKPSDLEPTEAFPQDRDPIHGAPLDDASTPKDPDPKNLPEQSHLRKHISRSGKKIRGSGKC